MKTKLLEYLVCPYCMENNKPVELTLKTSGSENPENDNIKQGALLCPECLSGFPIINYIPRFVAEENYANNFGLQWNIHYKTQYDSYIGKPVTETRFYETTHWDKNLAGQLVLEAGCGSGRFTEQVLKTGAMLISFDYSSAVDANYRNNGHNDNVLIIQADIRKPPLRYHTFDKVFCLGVLQHTPDPHASFESLIRFIKPDGQLAIDVYKRNLFGKLFSFTPAPPTKYLLRPLTKRMSSPKLYRAIELYIKLMWPLCRLIKKIPKIGRNINWMLLVADHTNLGIDDKTAREWACLNTFDMLSPRYDIPQRLKTVKQWFSSLPFDKVEVEYGHNGIVARAENKSD